MTLFCEAFSGDSAKPRYNWNRKRTARGVRCLQRVFRFVVVITSTDRKRAHFLALSMTFRFCGSICALGSSSMKRPMMSPLFLRPSIDDHTKEKKRPGEQIAPHEKVKLMRLIMTTHRPGTRTNAGHSCCLVRCLWKTRWKIFIHLSIKSLSSRSSNTDSQVIYSVRDGLLSDRLLSRRDVLRTVLIRNIPQTLKLKTSRKPTRLKYH